MEQTINASFGAGDLRTSYGHSLVRPSVSLVCTSYAIYLRYCLITAATCRYCAVGILRSLTWPGTARGWCWSSSFYSSAGATCVGRTVLRTWK